MAKLGAYYSLCPIIDSKNLLGISEDFKKGFVIVTLDKNIASKYKIADQKQLYSWRTKEKFSSPILFDTGISKYVAAFNQSYIKLWNEEEDMDKVKKYKFQKQIYNLFLNNGLTYIVFQNGSIYLLQDILDIRKTLEPKKIISEVEQVEDFLTANTENQFYFGLLTKSNDDLYVLHWTNDLNNFFKIKLIRAGKTLKGYVLHIFEDAVHLLTLWSDGKLFICPLKASDVDIKGVGDLFTVIETVSSKHAVSMLSLDKNYIAMYGASSNEEGAVLIIYNTQFKVIQSKQQFKLFTNGAKLWRIDNNLLTPVGQNLAVVPFQLETEQLAALIGSHKAIQMVTDDDVEIMQELEITSWIPKQKSRSFDIPKEMEAQVQDLIKQGLPESLILDEILPDIIKKQDINLILSCLKTFTDIPEKYLAMILKFVLANGIITKDYLNDPLNGVKSNKEHRMLVNRLLSKPFSEVLLLPYLRSELAVSDVLLFLNFLCSVFGQEEFTLAKMDKVKTEQTLLDWCCVLLDSSYQMLLLSKDKQIEEALKKFNEKIEENINCLENFRYVLALVSYIQSGKRVSKSKEKKYSIEQITLY